MSSVVAVFAGLLLLGFVALLALIYTVVRVIRHAWAAPTKIEKALAIDFSPPGLDLTLNALTKRVEELEGSLSEAHLLSERVERLEERLPEVHTLTKRVGTLERETQRSALKAAAA